MSRARVLRWLASVALVAVTAIAGSAIVATPAHAAASSDACAANATADHCDGAAITTSSTDRCWASSYAVADHGTYTLHGKTINPAGARFTVTWNGWTFITELRYSKTCKSNFTLTTVTGSDVRTYTFSNKVRRSALSEVTLSATGSDGPYLMEHADWKAANIAVTMGDYVTTGYQLVSRLVYSPNNFTQACFSNIDSDQYQCTTGGYYNDGYY